MNISHKAKKNGNYLPVSAPPLGQRQHCNASFSGRRPNCDAPLFGWRHHLLERNECSDLLSFSCPEELFTYDVSQKWRGLDPPLSAQIRNSSKIYETKVNSKEENMHIRITYTNVK